MTLPCAAGVPPCGSALAPGRRACNSITMQFHLPDPFALTTGLAPRLAVAGGVVALVWAAVVWAW